MLESVQTLVHGEFGETLSACVNVNEEVMMNKERNPRFIDREAIVSDINSAGWYVEVSEIGFECSSSKSRERVAKE
jgi:hypothetical protein